MTSTRADIQGWLWSAIRSGHRAWRYGLLVGAVVSLACSTPAAAVDYFWLNGSGGLFRQPAFWTPFDPVLPLPILLGPGGANDNAHFNLGRSVADRYGVTDVHGENNRLLVHDDALTLQISDYSLLSAVADAASLSVGVSPGDTADVILTGNAGATLETMQVVIGDAHGSSGRIDVTGGPWQWTSSQIRVGRSGTGTLNLEHGGNVISGSLGIGVMAGSSGNVAVRGQNTTWTSTGAAIGSSGSGSLTIEDGGSFFSSGESNLGFARGSNGAVTVRGSGSNWHSRRAVLAYAGRATITIEDGASATSNDVWLGGWTNESFNTSTAVATVRGEGSSWTIDTDPQCATCDGDLNIGTSNTAALHIESGGVVANVTGWIGLENDSFGSVFVRGDGSNWTNAADLIVGEQGWGNLLIQEGGSVTNATGWIANQAGSNGTATVRGPGSRWTNSGQLFVGAGGSAALTVEQGGTVSNTGVWIGTDPGSTGSATVRGSGSSWENNGQFIVGYRSSGSLSIEAGGTVSNSSGTNTIGFTPVGSSSQVTVSGAGSAWDNTGDLVVGHSGDATLVVSDHGAVSNANGIIGNAATGAATVVGVGTTWSNSGSLIVGNSGTGKLTIEDGGIVLSSGAAVAAGTQSTGEVVVSGSNSSWAISGGLELGGTSGGNGGKGTLTIAAGGLVNVSEKAALFSDGVIHLGDGTLVADEIEVNRGGEFDWNSGRLEVATFGGNLTNAAGTLAPPGQMSVLGTYLQQSQASLEIDLGGGQDHSQHDRIRVQGTALLGGELQVAVGNGFVPNVSDVFTILEADTVSGSFANVLSGGRLDTLDAEGSFLVSYGGASRRIVLSDFMPLEAIGLETLPEPSTSVLCLGLVAMSLLARTRRDDVRRSRWPVRKSNQSHPHATLRTWRSPLSAILCVAAMCCLQLPALAVDYVRTAAGGAFRVPQFWQPFQLPPVPLFGPGGSDDTANFNLHVPPQARYTVTSVSGENDQLVVNTDSLALEIIDYSLPWNNSAFPGMIVGFADGDVGDVVLTGGDGATLVTGGILIGEAAASTGVVAVDGPGLHWTAGRVMVGRLGTGTLTLEDGATVASSVVWVGSNAGSNGTFTIRGADSNWTDSSDFIVGYSGTGVLTIDEGGTVNSNYGTIGNNPDAVGTVMIRGGGSTWTNSVELQVGDRGTGAATIEDGGRLASGGLWIATSPGSTGSVSVRGSGSTLASSGQLHAGYRGGANLTIEQGGNVSSSHSTIGFGPQSNGTVTVSGSASKWDIAGRLEIGGTATFGNGGTGTLRIEQNGAVRIAEQLTLFPDGRVDLDGGTLAASTVDAESGGEFDWSGGRLEVGTYHGHLENHGGTLAPTGNTAILGDYLQLTAATLEIEIGRSSSRTEDDSVSVSGIAQLGGELEIVLVDDFVPPPRQSFTVLSAISLLDSFTNVGNNQRLDAVGGRGSFLVNYGPGSLFDENQIVLTDFQVSTRLAADFDKDGDVDGDDFLVWQVNFNRRGPHTSNSGDADGDGDVDGNDFLMWQQEFDGGGQAGSSSSTAVPEPATALLLIMAVAFVVRR